MELNSAVSHHLVANTDNAEARLHGELPDIPTLGSFTLEQILQYHLRVVDVLSKHEMREQALLNKTTFLGMIETANKLLVLFKAAKTTYFDKKRSQSGLERNMDGSGLVCLRSAVSIGRQTLQEEEADKISRTVIKSSVMQFGRDVADLKGWFHQFRNKSDVARHTDRDTLDMEELERVLTSIWALIAGTRE